MQPTLAPFNALPSRLVRPALATALLLFCSACDPADKVASTPQSASSPAFAVVALSATNLEGGEFTGGVLVVDFSSGAVSACYQACALIGKVEPAEPHDLVLSPGVGDDAYLTNIATGRVVRCDVTIDEDQKFKGGRCENVGTARS